MSRSGGLIARMLVAVVLMIGLAAQAGGAQDNDAVRLAGGAAGPLWAPVLGPGDYDGDLVTGESLWFQVLVPDGADIDIAVDLLADAVRSDLTLEVALLQADLVTSVGANEVTGPEEAVRVSGVASNTGLLAGRTVAWSVRVSLRTTGLLGEPVPARMSIVGTAAALPGQPCGRDCPQQEELDDLEAEAEDLGLRLEEARAQSDAVKAAPEVVQRQAELQASRDRLNELTGSAAAVGEVADEEWPVVRLGLLGFMAVAFSAAAMSCRGRRLTRR